METPDVETKDPYVQENDDGTVTILFEYPIPSKVAGKDPTSEVILKRPKVCDLEASDAAKGEAGKVVLMVTSLSNLPRSVIQQMDMADFQRVSAWLNGASGKKSQATVEE